jgi:nitric oxide reductase activation protein
LSKLPSKEALVEILIRFSLKQTGKLKIPKKLIRLTSTMWKIIKPLSNRRSIVEDSAEATIRLYKIISEVNNKKSNEEDEDEDFEMNPSDGQGINEDSPDESGANSVTSEAGDSSGNIQQYQSPEQVDYRGDFKPELMQAISMIKDYQKEHETSDEGISKETIEQILSEADTPPSEAERIDPNAKGTFASEMAQNLDSKGNPQAVLKQNSYAYDSTYDDEDRKGPLEANDPDSFLYDEWDYRISDYRNRWCLLREKSIEEGDSAYFTSTLDGYSSLASQIRRQFELMSPQGLQNMRRQQDGDELELEAVIEAIVDKKSGSTPSDKVYLRRNKVQRDVAVVFLLDMSASTAEAIDETRRQADEWDAPDDPLEYMFWLRSRRGEGMRRSYKRIIDLEKESIVLLIHALETIGDTYGIYGFSGYGRENVDFFVIKDVQETLTERVKRRIDKIAPLQATRMGPAIRHATRKLATVDARTKFLVLISDGRPQDRGYSREGVEKEYAIHDTRIALTEARRDGVTPFCLTVDKEGHDYLRAMCQDMGYEVLADINNLPKRLPALYRHLTI